MPQTTHLTALQQNARTLRSNGDLAGARLMLEQGLEVAKASLGEDHPEVLAAAHQLAGLHHEAGEPAAARRVLEEAVAAGQLRFTDGEPLMLALSYALGTVAEELGNRHEARRNFGRVATAGPAVLGEDHVWVRVARDYLGGGAVPAPPPPTQPPVSGSPALQPTQPTVAPAPPPQRPPAPQPSPPPQSPPAPPLQSAPAPSPSPSLPSAPPAFQPVQAPPAPVAYQQPAYHAQPPVPQHVTFGPGTGITATPAHVSPQQPIPEPAPGRRGRGATVAAAIAAAAAVVAAAVAAVVVLTDRGTTDPPQGRGASTAPAAQAQPPGRVRVSVDGNVVTVSWTDPTDGTVPFIIAGSRAGEEQRIMGQAKAGETKYPLNGLKTSLDYCFVVIAVYSSDQLVPSERVCTQRSARPSDTGAGG